MIVARMVILGVIVLLNTYDYFVDVLLVHVGRAGIEFAWVRGRKKHGVYAEA
jgi:hypothetical protein